MNPYQNPVAAEVTRLKPSEDQSLLTSAATVLKEPPKTRILLVEDDDALRLTLRRSLERAGYETVEAAHGREALARLAEGPVDLVITDIVMPEMEGVELILQLRRSHPRLPVIAMSGGGRTGGDEYLKLARAGGAAKLLAKPFKPEQLLLAVREVLSSPDPATG